MLALATIAQNVAPLFEGSCGWVDPGVELNKACRYAAGETCRTYSLPTVRGVVQCTLQTVCSMTAFPMGIVA
eukprot:26963-Eustigmatos_ZCMA.PRE.1